MFANTNFIQPIGRVNNSNWIQIRNMQKPYYSGYYYGKTCIDALINAVKVWSEYPADNNVIRFC